MKQVLTIPYEEYRSAAELDEADRSLLEAAIDATAGSYSPFSHYQVGAAVRLADGTVVKGANQENSAFPSGLCAERTALFAASAQYPDNPPEALALVAMKDGVVQQQACTPCGACRQVMAQYELKAGRPMRIIMGGAGQILVFEGVASIMPFPFQL